MCLSIMQAFIKNILNPRVRPPLSEDGFEIHWRTNYLGTFHLTSLLLPLLKQGGLESGGRTAGQRVFPPA